MQTTENQPITGNLLVIDPGGSGKGHTGIVLMMYTDKHPAMLVDSWAVPGGLEGFLEWLRDPEGGYSIQSDHFSNPNGVRVVCETFVNRNIPGADLTPVLVEGAVRTVFDDVILQPAAGKNTAVPDEVLKRLGLYDIGTGDHHQDRREAARHAIWYLKKLQHMPTLLHGWPRT